MDFSKKFLKPTVLSSHARVEEELGELRHILIILYIEYIYNIICTDNILIKFSDFCIYLLLFLPFSCCGLNRPVEPLDDRRRLFLLSFSC